MILNESLARGKSWSAWGPVNEETMKLKQTALGMGRSENSLACLGTQYQWWFFQQNRMGHKLSCNLEHKTHWIWGCPICVEESCGAAHFPKITFCVFTFPEMWKVYSSLKMAHSSRSSSLSNLDHMSTQNVLCLSLSSAVMACHVCRALVATSYTILSTLSSATHRFIDWRNMLISLDYEQNSFSCLQRFHHLWFACHFSFHAWQNTQSQNKVCHGVIQDRVSASRLLKLLKLVQTFCWTYSSADRAIDNQSRTEPEMAKLGTNMCKGNFKIQGYLALPCIIWLWLTQN